MFDQPSSHKYLLNFLGISIRNYGVVLALAGSGLLMGLAPVNAWPLAWVAMIPLWQIAHHPQLSLRRALSYAAIWGVAYHGTALSWIMGFRIGIMWMGISWLSSLVLALFAWAFITLWGAAIGITWIGLMRAVNRWQPVTGATRVLVGTALWCAVEWVWSKGPLYWTSLSYTQSPDNLLGLQLGQLSGPLAVTAAIVAVNGWLAEDWAIACPETTPKITPETAPKAALSLQRGESGRTRKRVNRGLLFGLGKQRPMAWAIVLFLGLHLLGLGLYSRPLVDRPDQALAVGLIQGNIPTNEKMTSKGTQASQQIYLSGYESLAHEGAELVLTPEGAIPQEWDAFLQDRNSFQQAVVKNQVPLILGTFVHQKIENNRTPLTQSLLTLTPEGKVAGRYNKVKLVPLGEYLPFAKVLKPLSDRLSFSLEGMAPGRFDQLLETPFGPMAAGICYESAFAELFRQQVARGGQAIFTASNNDPYSSRQMMQHHAQDVMRAVETNRWEVRVTNTGISGVVDPKGRSHWLSTPNEYATHLETIYRRHTRTPYVRWGDWLTPLLLIVAAIATARQKNQSRPGQRVSE